METGVRVNSTAVRRLAAFQAAHPYLLMAVLVASCVPAGIAAARLKLRTDWTELLPENKRSIVDLRRIQDRIGGSGTFTVVVEGGNLPAMERFADDLAARIQELPSDLVRYVDKDVRDERAFFERNRYLYADTADLAHVRDTLRARITQEKTKAALDLGLDDEDEEPAQGTAKKSGGGLDLKELKERYDAKVQALDKFPGGYYVGEGGHLLALFVRTASSSSNITATNRLEQEVNSLVATLNPGRYDPSLKIDYAGDVVTAREEHDAVRKELLLISALSIGLILASIYLFYFEVRAIFVLGASITIGLLWTFALTWAHIGYLSTATAFLASIVAGNGINSGIILIARYLEERRRGIEGEEAAAIALETTWAPTLTASFAAALSYGALQLTDFRGFSQFGFIGGTGLLITWLVNYLTVPTLLILTQRHAPRATRAQRRGDYGRPFYFLATHAPQATIAVALVLAVFGGIAGHRWVTGDVFEYDFRKLRNSRSVETGAGALQSRVSEMLKGRPREGMVVLADRPDQVPLIRTELLRVRDEHAQRDGKPPIGDVRTIETLVPAEQEAKRALLAEIRDLALQVLPSLGDKDRAELEPWVPPATVPAVTLEDVPPTLKRPFTEKDARVGLMLYVEPAPGTSIWDGRGLLRFADAVRSIQLPDGETVHSSGRPVIFADMLDAILHDGGRLTIASFVAIVLLVVFTFRRPAPSVLILFALAVGMLWMVGLVALWDLKLNFLNFIAIPITFGIGVDYAVNMVRRYALDGWGATREVLMETGGAVILCSLTTIFGYLSLLVSDNQALRSFGKLAVLGEITCLLAAVAVVPAIGMVAYRRRVSGTTAADPAES